MIQIQSHQPTTAELFPFAYQQDLLKIQSEHFVSNALSDGNVESGYKNMPIDFPSAPDNLPLIVNSKPPSKYVGTYLKNNWKPMLIMGIVGVSLAYAYYTLKEKKSKKSGGTKIPKTIYYNLQ
jgi:hypothetical protein